MVITMGNMYLSVRACAFFLVNITAGNINLSGRTCSLLVYFGRLFLCRIHMTQSVLKSDNLTQVKIGLNGITHMLLFACVTQEFHFVCSHLVELLERLWTCSTKTLAPGSTDLVRGKVPIICHHPNASTRVHYSNQSGYKLQLR